MHRILVATSLACLISGTFVGAQRPTFGCPAGLPASPWPGPAFVPTYDCQGWVTPSHPLAKPPTTTQPQPTTTPLPQDVEQRDIYGRLEMPTTVSRSAGGITTIGGWAADCILGTMPPGLKVIEQKPDGSVREIPNDYFYLFQARPDVQGQIRATCPNVDHVPLSDGSNGGPNDLFGWRFSLRSPITELGVHTFTVTWTWEPQRHAGSTSIMVNIVP